MISFKIKNYLPVVLLIILTAALMIYFKYSNQSLSVLIEDQKDNLVDLYAENLRPLITSSPIENEDVFNFAVYNNLPVSKYDNRAVKVMPRKNSREIIQLQENQEFQPTENYKNFTNYLNLDQKQKTQLDSILQSYKEILNNYVLVGDNNVVAVNTKINILNQTLRAEIINFLNKTSPEMTGDVFNEFDIMHFEPVVEDMKESAQEIDEGSFVVFAEDTIMNLKLDLNDSVVSGNNVFFAMPEIPEKDLILWKEMSKNSKSAEFECPKILKVQKEKAEEMKEKLTSISEKLKDYKFKLDKNSEHHKEFFNLTNDIHVEGDDTVYSFNFKFNIFDKENGKYFKNNMKVKDWEQFGLVMDSLSGGIEIMLNDSTFRKNAGNIKIKVQSD